MMNRIICYPKVPPPKGGSETLIRCFASKTGILSMKFCYSFFALKLSNKNLHCARCAHRVAQKCTSAWFCEKRWTLIEIVSSFARSLCHSWATCFRFSITPCVRQWCCHFCMPRKISKVLHFLPLRILGGLSRNRPSNGSFDAEAT